MVLSAMIVYERKTNTKADFFAVYLKCKLKKFFIHNRLVRAFED